MNFHESNQPCEARPVRHGMNIRCPQCGANNAECAISANGWHRDTCLECGFRSRADRVRGVEVMREVPGGPNP